MSKSAQLYNELRNESSLELKLLTITIAQLLHWVNPMNIAEIVS